MAVTAPPAWRAQKKRRNGVPSSSQLPRCVGAPGPLPKAQEHSNLGRLRGMSNDSPRVNQSVDWRAVIRQSRSQNRDAKTPRCRRLATIGDPKWGAQSGGQITTTGSLLQTSKPYDQRNASAGCLRARIPALGALHPVERNVQGRGRMGHRPDANALDTGLGDASDSVEPHATGSLEFYARRQLIAQCHGFDQ